MDAATTRPDDVPLALPPTQPPAQAPPFPVVASIAPLVASGVIWAMTQSPFALVFAALSPVIALAGVADGRWNARKSRRRAAADRALALTGLRAELEQRHAAERDQWRASAPSAREVMAATGRIGRWSADVGSFAAITLGTGDVRSSLRLGGEPQTDDERELMAHAGELARAPVVADTTLGLGLIGSAALTRALARGYLLQLMHAFSPGSVRVDRVPAAGWDWARSLPQFSTQSDNTPNVVSVRSASDAVDGIAVNGHDDAGDDHGLARRAVIAMAESLDRLPVPCRVIVEITGPGTARVLAGPHILGRTALAPELIAEAPAAGYARQLAEHAAAIGLARTRGELPTAVAFDELERHPAHAPGSTLDSPAARMSTLHAVVGISAHGPVVLDLVADGPHAVVGGTTGSGKSEFLTAWVAAIAAEHTPHEVGFLLVDFKGGSAFAPLTRLAHCVGLITDLGHGEAERALSSLKAELRHRERVLARLGARDITEAAGELGRLVIVVDEFAAMLDTFPELHALFVDIAARGRSLGVHTILCTQRPAGVVRDALLANCALRISLRVNNAVDSVAVVGTDAASRLSSAQPGRCIVARDGSVLTAQIAQVTAADIDRIALASSATGEGMRAPRRPWLDPLPAIVRLHDITVPSSERCDLPSRSGARSACAVVLGVEDVPEEQRQSAVVLEPAQLHLLVTGVHGSGKSVLAHSIAAQWSGELHAANGQVEALWDAIEWAEGWCEPGVRADAKAALLLLDDVDALVGRMPQEYQDVATDRLLRILRNGPTSHLAVVATAVSVTAGLRRTATLFSDTLLLRQSSRQEHVLAGGIAALFDERAHPGCGVWRGHKLQVAFPAADVLGATTPQPPNVPVERLDAGATILVTHSPGARIRSLRRSTTGPEAVDITDGAASAVPTDGAEGALWVSTAGGRPRSSVLVGDPNAWQARWSLFASLRTRCRIVFDGCAVTDVRALLQTRVLPPLIADSRHVWVREPDGALSRARLTLENEN